jgi:hypothetical protein
MSNMEKHTDNDKPTALCLRCGRKLTNKESMELGYGVSCYKRLIDEPIKGQISVEEVLDYAKI